MEQTQEKHSKTVSEYSNLKKQILKLTSEINLLKLENEKLRKFIRGE